MPYLKIVHNEETLEVMDIRYFDCGDGFTYVKTHPKVYFKCVQQKAYQLYLNQAAKKETKKLHVMFKILK